MVVHRYHLVCVEVRRQLVGVSFYLVGFRDQTQVLGLIAVSLLVCVSMCVSVSVCLSLCWW